MAGDKVRMPSSMGGLVSYTDEYTTKITFKPAYVVVICIAVMIIAILLHIYGSAWLGL
ncbi:preprotein translocase subunit Sec61beta [Candidatus Woesearchaeota archaeon]|nr:preprotein translocase subunit Sec61beta [Candidatus Woesearchaeota archaeon]